MHISHTQQKLAWQKEHKKPKVLVGLASRNVSGGVKNFWKYFNSKYTGLENPCGLEMCCGKGRNSIWLATQGTYMTGFDFSSEAIKTAKKRVTKKIIKMVNFLQHDAIRSWPFSKNSFDFVVDCFGSTDIDGAKNRKFVSNEIWRVLKPGGYFFIYTNSVRSDFYKEMYKLHSVAKEKNAYYYPDIKKFEKVFTKNELMLLHQKFKLKEIKTYKRKSKINSKVYSWEHFWIIYQKPL